MRRLRYAVAASLDGYIAGPNGEADWITMDPEFDFGALYAQFDTVFVGRRTFETMSAAGRSSLPGMQMFVFSHMLQQADYPGVIIVPEHPEQILAELRAAPGKDIWLFGGGALFRSLAAAGLVDTVELAVMPVLLGGGLPLAPELPDRVHLTLSAHKVSKIGVVSLEYAVKK